MRRWVLVGSTCVYVLYLVYYVWRTLFVVDGVTYSCLFDDMMVSMRYAANLAAGHGLVWNVGEAPIEGYTNFLWVGVMALVHLLPIPIEWTSLAVQILGGIILIAVVWASARTLRQIGASEAAQWACATITALYLPLVNWSLQGTEVGLLALVTLLATIRAVQILRGQREEITSTYLLLAIGLFVRPDAAVVFGATALVLAFEDRPRRWRHLVVGGSIGLASMLALTIFREVYFGDALPNTYYLKMFQIPLALRLARGFYVVMGFAWGISLPITAGALLTPFLQKNPIARLLAIQVLSQLLYSLWVGGDAWEWWGSRYTTVVMPIFFVLLASLASDAVKSFADRAPNPMHAGRSGLLWTAAVVLAIVQFNGITHPVRGALKLAAITPPINTDINASEVRLARLITDVTTTDAVVAVNYAGVVPYFSRRPTIDLLGKSDRHVARVDPVVPTFGEAWLTFQPGHLKRDSRYSFQTFHPDLSAHLPYDFEQIKQELSVDYALLRKGDVALLVRRDSEKVDVQRLADAGFRPAP